MKNKHSEKENIEDTLKEKTAELQDRENIEKEVELENEVNEEKNDVEDLKIQLAELNDKHIRLFSEFDNFRRRTAKEKLELIKTASESVVLSLLPVMDDFERALAAYTGEEQEMTKKGIELIYNKLSGTLTQQGLKVLEIKEGKFDADVQEAVAQVPAESEDMKGKVIDVIQKGYVLHDKVIRFAKVVVAV